MTWYFVFLYWSGYWNQTQTMGLLQLISVSHSVVRVSFVSLCHWNILAFCTLFLLFISLLTSFWVHNREFLSPLATDVTSISVDFKTTNSCHSNGRPPPLTTFRFLFAVISFESNLFGELAPLIYIVIIFFQCLLLSCTQRLRQVRCHNCNTRHHLLYSNWQQYQCADNCCFMASYFSCIFLVPFREDKDAA